MAKKISKSGSASAIPPSETCQAKGNATGNVFSRHVKLLLALGIVGLLLILLFRSESSFIALIVFMVALVLIVDGLFCIYYALKFAGFNPNKVGNEAVMPLFMIIVGLAIFALA